MQDGKTGKALENIAIHEVVHTPIDFKIENIYINADTNYDETELGKKVAELKDKPGSFLLLTGTGKEGINARKNIKIYIEEKCDIKDELDFSLEDELQAPEKVLFGFDPSNAKQLRLLASKDSAIFCFDDKSVNSAKQTLEAALKYQGCAAITLYRVVGKQDMEVPQTREPVKDPLDVILKTAGIESASSMKLGDFVEEESSSFRVLDAFQKEEKVLTPLLVLGAMNEKESFINAVASKFSLPKERFITEITETNRKQILQSGMVFCCGTEGVAEGLKQLEGDGNSLVEGEGIFESLPVYKVKDK